MGVGAPAIVTGQKFLLCMHHAGSVFEPVVQDNCGIFKFLAIHGGENEKSAAKSSRGAQCKSKTDQTQKKEPEFVQGAWLYVIGAVVLSTLCVNAGFDLFDTMAICGLYGFVVFRFAKTRPAGRLHIAASREDGFMAKQKQRLTEKVDPLAGLALIAMCAAPVIWCAHTGTSFDYIVSLALGAVASFVLLWLALCIAIGILGIMSGR